MRRKQQNRHLLTLVLALLLIIGVACSNDDPPAETTEETATTESTEPTEISNETESSTETTESTESTEESELTEEVVMPLITGGSASIATQCLENEIVYFSCQLEDTESAVSLCASEGFNGEEGYLEFRTLNGENAETIYRYPEGENQPFKYAEDGGNQALSFGTDSLIHELAIIGTERTYSSFNLTESAGIINNCAGNVVNQLGELVAFVPSIQWQGTPVRDQVAALSETGEPAETPTTTTTTNDGVYIVKAGDTVFTIAQALGVDWQTIVEDNNLVAPYTIYVNQQLIVPDGGEVTIYTVVFGDSLTTIGEQFGLDWSTLAQANGIGWPYWVYPGQELIIPAAP